ncbi:hypothetical protein ABFP37_13795 [Burkholderia sp. RS01]|uniref:hypothetical protein n=1 Tax=Burkholderia sp. RS01 TaxID=3139774 RepID=UPI003218529F
MVQAAIFQNLRGIWTPRYGTSSSARTGPVKTLILASCPAAWFSTWSSSPSHNSLPWVEVGSLRGGVGVGEGVLVGGACRGVIAPHGVKAADQMAAVQAVVAVDLRPGLHTPGHPGVEMPDSNPVKRHQLTAVDVDADHGS